MLFPTQNVAGNTNVPVIVAQVLEKPAMGNSPALNVLSVKSNVPTNALLKASAYHRHKLHLRARTPEFQTRLTKPRVLSPLGILDL